MMQDARYTWPVCLLQAMLEKRPLMPHSEPMQQRGKESLSVTRHLQNIGRCDERLVAALKHPSRASSGSTRRRLLHMRLSKQTVISLVPFSYFHCPCIYANAKKELNRCIQDQKNTVFFMKKKTP